MMQTAECEKCGAAKPPEVAGCPDCAPGTFKEQLYWMPMAAIACLLIFSFSRVENPADHDEMKDRQAIDACRAQAERGPHTLQDPPLPCEPLIEEFILNYGYQPD
jgi:hypothetical protein